MALDVELIDEEDIKVKGGIEKKRKDYKKYSDAVNRINLVAWIKEEIEKKPEKTIVVKIDDVSKEMGPEFKKVNHQILYQALKVILFQNGIFLSMATHMDGDKTFVLRKVRKGDQLAQSYLFVKHNEAKETKTGIESHPESDLKRIIKEKLSIQEKEKERQEIIAMLDEIRKLKEILNGRLGRLSCMIEIFQFNWNTLTWRMVKRSSVRTYIKLLELVMNNTSTTENRYRIEFTPLYQLENMGKDLPGHKELGEQENRTDNIEDEVKGGENEANGEKAEQIKELKEGEGIECPRCGSYNIKTWSTVQVIKTRSGDRKLRHRCENCNETFTDEDLGIKQ